MTEVAELAVALKTVVFLLRVFVRLTSAKLLESRKFVPVSVIDLTEDPATVAEELEIELRIGELALSR